MSDVKYTLVDTGELESDHWGIHINSGEFEDTIFKYGAISFGDDEDENGNIHVTFDYDVLDPPFPYEGDKLIRFNEVIGWILNDVIMGALEEKNGTIRNGDTEEPDVQRDIHEEGIPIS